jgi:hypothetical protein
MTQYFLLKIPKKWCDKPPGFYRYEKFFEPVTTLRYSMFSVLSYDGSTIWRHTKQVISTTLEELKYETLWSCFYCNEEAFVSYYVMLIYIHDVKKISYAAVEPVHRREWVSAVFPCDEYRDLSCRLIHVFPYSGRQLRTPYTILILTVHWLGLLICPKTK